MFIDVHGINCHRRGRKRRTINHNAQKGICYNQIGIIKIIVKFKLLLVMVKFNVLQIIVKFNLL